MPIDRSGWGVGYSSVCVFLLGALCLVVSSGYSFGPVMLLLASLPLLAWKPAWPAFGQDEKVLIGVLALFMLVWVAEVVLTGQRSRELDKPSRFLAAILAFVWLLKFPPKAVLVWSGVAVGALGASGLAVWELFVEGAERASGYTHPIQFGNVSMLLGLLCVAGLGWALSRKHRALWSALLLVGFVMGFVASMLSGSRGGWIGLPFVFLVLYRSYKPWLQPMHVAAAFAAGLVLVVAVYLVPQTGVQARVMSAVDDIQKYSAGNADTSVGARFEMWKGAGLMIVERPLTGWGSEGYRARMQELSELGEVAPVVNQFDHAHNEFLDVFAKRGVLGLTALLLLYFLPLRMFLARAQGDDPAFRAIAASGSVLCVAYIDFSLTQSFLSHNSGVMVFVFYLVTFWSMLAAYPKTSSGLKCTGVRPQIHAR
jgi:O-antigen ligase